ncbi:hypothetical protein CA13_08060 [Planctomycetes bacterium CA13]|uniref:Uncharacterized protein n=1 Tax=Novipirellula herctigrandis TaxID=2527986 RepID=A0A5C5YX97_9BACT|nr:hypothetical protein CA13_08060 [Planctomycetes bacterium CA13]
MSDNLALLRFAWTRHRLPIVVFAVMLAITECFVLSLPIRSREPSTFASFLLLITFLPAFLWGVIAFDFVHMNDLASSETGYSHFLLRMPIAEWKLAAIPIVMKTLWVGLLWWLVCLIAWKHDGLIMPMSILFVSIVATGVWVSAIAWRPFRAGWHRFVAFAVLAPIASLAVAGTGIHSATSPLTTFLILLIIVGEILFLVIGIVFAVRAIHVARSNVVGKIPSTSFPIGKRFWQWLDQDFDDQCSRHEHRTATNALRWHDLKRSRGNRVRVLFFLVVPTILLFSMLDSPPGVSLFLGCFMLFVFANSGIYMLIEPTSHTETTTLPPYLAASPLSSEEIASTRLGETLSISLRFMLMSFLYFVIWLGFETHREAWHRWATDLSTMPTVDGLPLASGIRVTVVAMVALVTFFLGRNLAHLWVTLAGRTWIAIGVIGTLLACMFAATFAVSTWFFKQREWEETLEAFYFGVSYIPSIIGLLMGVKAIGLTTSLGLAYRSNTTSIQWIQRTLLTWLVGCVVIGVVLFALIPDSRATLPMCLAFPVLVLPVARLLVLPIAVDQNRHR